MSSDSPSLPASTSPLMLWVMRLTFILAVVWFAFGCWRLRDIGIDDAYITYRFGYRLAHNGDLQWNQYEAPVEGYTSFLAVVISAAFERLEWPPLASWQVLGILLALGGAGAAVAAGRILSKRYWPQAERLGVPWLAGTTWLASPVVPVHAMSGMETMLFASLLSALTALALRIALSEACPRLARVALALGFLLLGMTRPEGVLWAAFVGAGVWIASGYWGRLRLANALLLFFVIPGAIYFTARWYYFGDMLPSTFHAKAGGAPSPLGRLHTYLPSHWAVWRYVRQNWLCLGGIGAVGLILHGWRERKVGQRLFVRNLPRDAVSLLLAGSLTCIAFFASVHIEIMGYADRFLFPFGQTLWVLVFFVVAASLTHFASGEPWRRGGWRRAGIACAVLGTFAVAGCAVRMSPVWVAQWDDAMGLTGPETMREPYRNMGTALETIAVRAERPITVFHHNMGLLYYFAPHVDSVDPVGLVDKHVAHHGFSVDYLFSRSPEIMVLPSKALDRITPYQAELFPDISEIVFRDPRMSEWQYLGYDAELRFYQTGTAHMFVKRDFLKKSPWAADALREALDLQVHPDFPENGEATP